MNNFHAALLLVDPCRDVDSLKLNPSLHLDCIRIKRPSLFVSLISPRKIDAKKAFPLKLNKMIIDNNVPSFRLAVSNYADCSSYATCLFNAFDPQRKGYLTFEVQTTLSAFFLLFQLRNNNN